MSDNRSADLATSLLTSGMKALEHAAPLLEAEPEMAVISFAIGIELSLKARLAFEHWHLILDSDNGKPDKAWNQLRSGKSRTVGGSKLQDLLARVIPLEEARGAKHAREAFNSLSELRNKAAHFGIQTDNPEQGRSVLTSIQLRAWHALRSQSEFWPEKLSSKADWERVERVLEDLNEFLGAKASEIEPLLKSIQIDGGAVGCCSDCSYISIASEETASENGPFLEHARCRVCHSLQYATRGPCPQCKRSLLVAIPDSGASLKLSCISCNFQGKSTGFGVVKQEKGLHDPQNDPGGLKDPHCGECESSREMVRLSADGDEYFFCRSCSNLHPFDLEDVEYCDHCSEAWIGVDLTVSGFNGCPLCDGPTLR